jgi:hypothetical protein
MTKQAATTAALEALRDADGLLHIGSILEAAADPASPLHDHFEWDDTEAAHRYRLGQARQLIRAQKISVRIGPAVIRSVAYVPADSSGAYRKLADIAPSSDQARQVILAELSRVAGALGRARNIASILHLESEIDHLLETLAAIREVAATAPITEAA